MHIHIDACTHVYTHTIHTCLHTFIYSCIHIHLNTVINNDIFWHNYTHIIHSFIHSGHFYSAPSSPLPLRGAPDYSTDTVLEFHAEAHRQLQVKDLTKVPT